MSSICSVLRYTVARVSFSLCMRIRRGKGSLHVMMVLTGSLASTWRRGGSVEDRSGTVALRKNPGFVGAEMDFENCCFRLANISWALSGGLGGSIGRNLKFDSWAEMVSDERNI